MLTLSLSVYKRAALCASNEETRYYLCGVYVEPCAEGGVLAVATDGLKLVVIHDPAGVCERPAIIGLHKPFLTAKEPRFSYPYISASDDMGAVFYSDANGEREATLGDTSRSVALVAKPFIGGSFSNWRCVLPQGVCTRGTEDSFGIKNVLEPLARALSPGVKNPRVTLYRGKEPLCPHYVLGEARDGFGVAMPIGTAGPDTFEAPAWIAAPQA